MTTIACNREAMAGDTQVTANGIITFAKKLFRLHDGSIAGISGCPSSGLELVAWLDGTLPNPPAKLDNVGVLVLRSDGTIWEYDESITPFEHVGSYAAIGSGFGVALGALEAGATIKRAVEIAAKRDIYTGGEVQVMKLAKSFAKPRRK